MKLEASKSLKNHLLLSLFFLFFIPLRFWLLITFTTKPSSLMMKLPA